MIHVNLVIMYSMKKNYIYDTFKIVIKYKLVC